MTEKMRSFVNGILMGLCGHPLAQGEPKEPIGYLYGHIAKEGETATHTIDGVGYVGNVLPNIESVYTPELQETYPYALINREDYNRHDDGWLYLYLADQPIEKVFGRLSVTGANYIVYKVHTYAEVVTQATWEFVKSDKADEYAELTDSIWLMWTNTDIYDTGIEVALAAADCVCIPIYE